MVNRELAHVTDSGEAGVGSVSVVDTTELRWFAEGRLAPEVTSWFTVAGTSGRSEERWDSYRIDGRPDVGVKRRFRETLERKIRRSIGEHFEVDSHLAGSPEVWRKWSPADGLVTPGENERWVDVHKVVLKRWFTVDGEEVAPTAGAAALGVAGCDAEIVAVDVGNVEAWTFAFAAFGPAKDRTNAIVAAWRTLTADSHPPGQFEALYGDSSGYPAWLARAIARHAGQPG